MPAVPPPLPPPPPPFPRYSPPPLPDDASCQGLGGWLILVGIRFVCAPFWCAYFLFHLYLPLLLPGLREHVADPRGGIFSPLLGPLIIGEAVALSLCLVANVALLCLFFGKRRVFPALMIWYTALNYAYVAADYIVAMHIPFIAGQDNTDTLVKVYASGVLCCLWIPYFVMSKRVKATFTR